MIARAGRRFLARLAVIAVQPVYHERMTQLRASDLAKAVGVHPNTVRRYAERGFLPPVARGPSGYRRFTPRHLDCLRVAHQV